MSTEIQKTLGQLDDIIAQAIGHDVALKAIKLKIDLLALDRPAAGGGAPSEPTVFDPDGLAALEDAKLRKRAAKLEEDIQRAIDRGRQ